MRPVRINMMNFECYVLQSELPVLLVFGFEWDNDSMKLFDQLQRAAEKFKGKIKTGIVDCDYCMEICSYCGLSSYPAMVFFEDGEIFEVQEGFCDSFDVKNFIYRFYGVLPDKNDFSPFFY